MEGNIDLTSIDKHLLTASSTWTNSSTGARTMEVDQTTSEANTALRLVQPIDNDSIRLLAAGEKINDIETAIRELVENSIDAQATNIEVRLSKFGAETIEVEDNGSGIDEKNFDHLASRYHTSKISDIKNLQESLETYGFRGEALSCLCKIANVTITTKTKTSPTGWKLTFKDGSLFKRDRMGRDKGTTVIVKNLFHSLAVRRRELELNGKKQYDKIVRLLYEQLLARPHIKFSLCKKVGTRKEKDFTHGGTTLEGCLITMYSIKLMDSLIPIHQTGVLMPPPPPPSGGSDLESSKMEDVTSAAGSQQQVDIKTTRTSMRFKGNPDEVHSGPEASSQEQSSQAIAPSRDEIFFKRARKSRYAREKVEYLIHGYISHIGKGRNSTDCQYIFVNKKPCDIPKISRCINEIYKSYNGNTPHYPFYCLFIQVQRWATDFNVPRKRGVILQDEAKLCDIVKDSLEKMYSSYAPASQKSCPVAQIPFAPTVQPSSQNGATPSSSPTKAACLSASERDDDGGEKKGELQGANTAQHVFASNQQGETSLGAGQKQQSDKQLTRSEEVPTVGAAAGTDMDHQNNPLLTLCSDVADSIPDLFESAPKRARISAGENTENSYPSTSHGRTPLKTNTTNNTATTSTALPYGGFQSGLDLLVEEVTLSGGPSHTNANASTNGATISQYFEKRPAHAPSSSFESAPTSNEQPPPRPMPPPSPAPRQKQLSPEKRAHPAAPHEPLCRFKQLEMLQNDEIRVSIDMAEDWGAALEREQLQRAPPMSQGEFSFAIDPKFNAPTEEELKFHLNKTSFMNMQVIGQFNRGFIIARLNKHLFIIDQHATDERANFEDQLEKSPLVKQPMVYSKPLYLSFLQENAIINNLAAFAARGLEFTIDPTSKVGCRVMLSATSICRGADRDEHLDKSDVEELADVALESPHRLETYTLKKVHDVAASIACRKSVMIGASLSWQQMERIVARMADLKNPWVCAHDRPTIRHLMDVDWPDK